MAAKDDYSENSRFRSDDGFQILSRQNLTIGTFVIMQTPVRGSRDEVIRITLRHEFRWDLVALDALGDVNLKWIVMRHNRVSDPLIGPRVGETYFVPTADQIRAYLSRR